MCTRAYLSVLVCVLIRMYVYVNVIVSLIENKRQANYLIYKNKSHLLSL